MRFRRSRERPTPAKHPCDFGRPGRPTPAKHPCDFGRPGRDLHQPSTLAISASDFGIRFRHPLSQRAEQLAAKLADVRFRTHASGFDRPILASQVLAGERSESPCLSGDPQHIPRAHPAARRDRERGRVVGGRVPRSVGRCSAPDGGDLRDTPRHRTAALDSQLDSEPAPEARPPQAGGGISDRRYVEVRLTFDGQIHAVMAREAMEELERELAVFVSPADRAAAGALLEAATALAQRGAAPDY